MRKKTEEKGEAGGELGWGGGGGQVKREGEGGRRED